MADTEMFDDPKTKEYLRQQFKLYDKDASETIVLGDVGSALRMCGFNPTEEDITKMVDEAEHEGDKVTFDKFLEFCGMAVLRYHSQDDCMNAFRAFDPDNKGTISQNDLRFILTTMGDALDRQEMLELMEQVLADPTLQDENFPPNVDYKALVELWMPPIYKVVPD